MRRVEICIFRTDQSETVWKRRFPATTSLVLMLVSDVENNQAKIIKILTPVYHL